MMALKVTLVSNFFQLFKKIIRIDSFLEVNAVQKNAYTISGNNFTKINNIKVNEI